MEAHLKTPAPTPPIAWMYICLHEEVRDNYTQVLKNHITPHTYTKNHTYRRWQNRDPRRLGYDVLHHRCECQHHLYGRWYCHGRGMINDVIHQQHRCHHRGWGTNRGIVDRPGGMHVAINVIKNHSHKKSHSHCSINPNSIPAARLT